MSLQLRSCFSNSLFYGRAPDLHREPRRSNTQTPPPGCVRTSRKSRLRFPGWKLRFASLCEMHTMTIMPAHVNASHNATRQVTFSWQLPGWKPFVLCWFLGFLTAHPGFFLFFLREGKAATCEVALSRMCAHSWRRRHARLVMFHVCGADGWLTPVSGCHSFVTSACSPAL